MKPGGRARLHDGVTVHRGDMLASTAPDFNSPLLVPRTLAAILKVKRALADKGYAPR